MPVEDDGLTWVDLRDAVGPALRCPSEVSCNLFAVEGLVFNL